MMKAVVLLAVLYIASLDLALGDEASFIAQFMPKPSSVEAQIFTSDEDEWDNRTSNDVGSRGNEGPNDNQGRNGENRPSRDAHGFNDTEDMETSGDGRKGFAPPGPGEDVEGGELLQNKIMELLKMRQQAGQEISTGMDRQVAQTLARKGFPIDVDFDDGFSVGVDTPIFSGGVDIDEDGFSGGVNTPVGGTSVAIGAGGVSVETDTLFGGWSASVDENGFAGNIDTMLGSIGTELGPNGINVNGEVNVMGIVGASFEAGCDSSGCHGSGDAWYNPDCAKFWLNIFHNPGSLLSFKTNPIQIALDAFRMIKAIVESVVAGIEGIAKNLNCLNIAQPDEMLECMPASTLDNMIAPVCDQLWDSGVVAQASQTIANMKSFQGSCLANLLGGQLMAWTRGFTLGFSASLSSYFQKAGVEIGISIGFNEKGTEITNRGCYIAGSHGISFEPGSVSVGLSAAAWKDYSQIAGHSLTAAIDVDLCKIFGLPCELEFGSGLVTTYADEQAADQVVSDFKTCLTAVFSVDWSNFIPVPNFSRCFGAFSTFVSRTNALIIPFMPSVGISAGLPVSLSFTEDYTHQYAASSVQVPGQPDPNKVLTAVSISNQIVQLGTVKNPEWTPWFSEENGGYSLNRKAPITGVGCSGGWCDNLRLFQGKYSTCLFTSDEWTPWIASNTNGYNCQQLNNCKNGRSCLVTQVQCKDGWCGSLRLRCSYTPNCDVSNNMVELPHISDEAGMNEAVCPSGSVFTGLRTFGDKSDNLHVRCSKIHQHSDHGSIRYPSWTAQWAHGWSENRDGKPVRAMACFGGWCSEKKLYQAKDSECIFYRWGTKNTHQFSEENGGNANCGANSAVTGMHCSGDRCDNIILKCQKSINCDISSEYQELPAISEEAGRNVAECPPNTVMTGAKCFGGWCDDISIRCSYVTVRQRMSPPGSPPASSDTPIYIQLEGQPFCIDSSRRHNGGELYIYNCMWGNGNQKFQFDGDLIKIENTNYCVRASGLSNGNAVQVWSCNRGDSYQRWEIVQEEIHLKDHPNKCLDNPGSTQKNGAGFVLWDCHKGFNQRFVFPNEAFNIWPEVQGKLYIQILGGRHCIDSSKRHNGGEVYVWDCMPGNGNQQFELVGGQIRLAGTSFCLDNDSGRSNNGNKIHLWSCNKSFGNQNQQWWIHDNEIKWAGNRKKCLDLDGNKRANGEKIHLWDCHQGEAQRWLITPYA